MKIFRPYPGDPVLLAAIRAEIARATGRQTRR